MNVRYCVHCKCWLSERVMQRVPLTERAWQCKSTKECERREQERQREEAS